VDLIGPVRKSYSGAGELHGTAGSWGQSPGAAARNPWSAVSGGSREDETSRRADGETAGRLETPKGALTREPEKNCEGHENPMSVAGNKTPGQAAITARDASPERVPIRKPATNDPRGRRLQ